MKYFAEHVLLPTGPARDVQLTIDDGRFTAVEPGITNATGPRLPGVVLPGFANNHSHAFHRALRGRTHDQGGTFWTWRERMYQVAGRLDPDSYLALARATYAEMALAGISAVGEFHYLHHAPGGVAYRDPNEMATALCQAAADAGIRLTLLDTCYLAGGLTAEGHLPVDPVQRRFADRDVNAWAARVGRLHPTPGMRVGVAAHSVRAVPRGALPDILEAAAGRPLHVHLSEQPAENEACQGFYGCSPTELLDSVGLLGPNTTGVHATHLTAGDIRLLGESRSTACFCPTTERDLADGIGPARALLDAGANLSLGSDQHAVIDLIEEARALEMHERLATRRRGRFTPAQLLAAMTDHAAIGWPDAGRIEVGARADLVAVRLDTVRTAGSSAEQILLSATGADVGTVLVDGVEVVSEGRHRLGDIGALMAAALEPVWQDR